MSAPPRYAATAALLLSTATLAVSYCLPTVTFHAVASTEQTYSIWGGIVSLWDSGHLVIAPLVFLFSMVFPITKLVALSLLLWDGLPVRWRNRWLGWVGILGKWSMLDVFIVAVFVAAVRLDLTVKGHPTGFRLATSSSEVGIHVFALAIVLSMGSAWLVARRFGPCAGAVNPAALQGAVGRSLAGLRATGLLVVLSVPLLGVSRAETIAGFEVNTSNEVHLWKTTAQLFREGEVLLALALGLFVVGFPILRALLSLWLRWRGAGSIKAVRLARGLDSWAMVDVLGLALLIIQVKLSELTTTTLLVGFWVTLAVAVLSQVESWDLRRSARPSG